MKIPEEIQSGSINDRAIYWITNCSTGMSSKTMWCCLMNQKYFPINHPYDADDFSRCYDLLQLIPEWKNELYKLKLLSYEWHNLVQNWDRLTEMYEQNKREHFENSRRIGMYEFMKKILSQK